MEYGALVLQNCAFGSLSDTGAVPEGADFIDELLVEGCWLETTDNLCGSSTGVVAAVADPNSHTQPAHYYMTAGGNCNSSSSSSSNHHQQQQQQIMLESGDDENGTTVVGKRWWIGPNRTNPAGGGPSSSVKERLVVAVGYLKEYTKNSNVVIQIWVPPRRGLHDQYQVHRNDHDHDHEQQLLSSSSPNPNLVNVRFFRSHEYPYAQVQQYDVRGCLALPVFQRGTGTCLGVLEILITNQNIINVYRPQLLHDNNIALSSNANALEAADFRSYQNFIQLPSVKVFEELYQAAVNEIVEVLTCVCKTHNLPLALTWAPCIQQGKCGCGHYSTTENCVSTVESACFVADVEILGFQEACSEYHLFRGQGIVGTAFTTTKPCFAIDITAFSKAEYPLAHHAKMFGLHAAVAIPLRSVYTGSSADFVLEFFLPKDCHDSEEQRQMLNSLSMFVQQACRSLHVVNNEDDFTLPPPPPLPPLTTHATKELHHHHHHHDHIHKLLFASDPSSSSQGQGQGQLGELVEAASASSSSWIAHMMEAQQKGKGVSVSLEYEVEEPKEEFKVTTNWDGIMSNEQLAQTTTTQVFSEYGQVEQISSGSRSTTVEEESYSFSGRRSSSSSGGRKSGEKRRTKAEKTISLPVLRQYFAGSLKDAAKSIGVCPTTLKRICRQHGITRWPSRKIKKVGHSLKKLQLVIDSVQGAEGAIQIGSFYTSFPELCSATARSDPSNKIHTYPPKTHNNNNNNNAAFLYGHGDSCSQTFGPTGNLTSTIINNTNNNNNNNNNNNSGNVLMTESPDALLNREAELQHASIQEEDTKHFTRSNKGHQHTLPPLSETSGWNSRDRGAFRVKATFVDEKIRFSLQSNWGFRDLQVEIARRFNLNDVSNMDLKYLDDEGEWVLLACDADLEECKDLHRSSQSRTIRLSLFQASPVNLANTFGSSSSPS